ncbi:MAG: hypothetical protein KDA65_03875 [Planctomycetaceae bacterium]|nr:hypothetical protein [Planctomycetaceae bacterium]
MRVRLWLSSIAGLLVISATTNVQAQYGGFPAPVTASYNAQPGMVYQGGMVDANGTSYYESSLPPGNQFAPNPYASPGGYYSDPLPDRSVFERILGAPFDVPIQVSVSYTRTRIKSPEAEVIGDSRVSTQAFFPSTAPVFIEGPPGPTTVNDTYLDNSPYPAITADKGYDEGPTGGLNFKLNFGSGSTPLQVTGFYNQNYQTGLQYGDRSVLNINFAGDPITRTSATGIGFPSDEEIDYYIDVFNPGLPYYTGVPLELDSDNALGDAIGFDTFFEMKFETQSYGFGLVQALSSVWEGDNFSLHPLVGVSYVGLREGFSLFGRQSGLDYTVTFPDGDISPNGTGNNTAPGQTAWAHINGMTDTIVDSKVNSNLIGPEAGMGASIGGRNFRILTSSKFGLMANREQIKLRGQNVFNNTSYIGPDLPFDQTETYTHLSPMFSTSIQAQCNLLRHVPVIRDIDLFDQAVVSAGYNFTYIWEVARPSSTIQWNGAPLVPEIEANREGFWMSGFEMGLHWTY